MINGAQIAFDEFTKANPDCQVKFDTSYDSQGAPDQATPLADTIVGKSDVIALLGPGFSGETKATMPKFEAAGLPIISPSATNALLSTNGWKMFHRVLANDDKQAPGIVNLIKDTVKGTKVGVIDDASEYGKGLADSVRKGLGALDVKDAQIDPKAADYSAAVTAMTSAGVDTVFYGGYYDEAAKLVTQLRDAGFEGKFVSGDGSLDIGFVKNAGEAGNGRVPHRHRRPAGRQPRVPGGVQGQVRRRPGPVLAGVLRHRPDLPQRHRRGQDHPSGHGRLRVGLRRAGHHQAHQLRRRRVSRSATRCSTPSSRTASSPPRV